jgi:AcrR family transcriptional regulator
MMIGARASLRREPNAWEGLRNRKKVKTRLAIEDAALELFAEQGFQETTVEQIAARAEISTTTFFRYFPGKADVILSDQDAQLPALRQAILDRPPEENDLVALRRALEHVWVATIDPERTRRTALAVASSPVLRGLSYDTGLRWLSAVKEALAQRKGLPETNEHCQVAARIIFGVFGAAVESWTADGCQEDIRDAIKRKFDAMTDLCGAWSENTGLP